MKGLFKAIIVEDQKSGVQSLVSKLERNCPEVSIIDICHTGESAVKSILKNRPHLVFLDIDLGSMSGFDVLEQSGSISSEVIFTTSFDEYAIKAFKVNALDYILKPIDEVELMKAVNKATTVIMNKVESFRKLPVPISNGVRFIPHEEIMYCEANDNMAYIHFSTGEKKLLVCRTLKDLTAKLPEPTFKRVHKSFTINQNYMKSLIKQDGGYIEMVNGDQVKVNLNNKKDYL